MTGYTLVTTITKLLYTQKTGSSNLS